MMALDAPPPRLGRRRFAEDAEEVLLRVAPHGIVLHLAQDELERHHVGREQVPALAEPRAKKVHCQAALTRVEIGEREPLPRPRYVAPVEALLVGERELAARA